jgi:hypothetical protein
MTAQRILWTALPNGRTERDGRTFLRLSVFVAPRLAPDGGRGKLGEFPDWVNWTDTAANLRSFELEVDGVGSFAARAIEPSPLEPTLWPRLFERGMAVQAFAFEDLASRTIVSFPVADTLGALRDSYQSLIFDSPSEPPALQRTLGALQPFAVDLTPQLAARLRRRLLEEQARNPLDIADLRRQRTARDATEATALALLFHEAAQEEQPAARAELPRPGPEMQDLIDFHKAVSMLGDYAGLMRRLGIVIDIELPAEKFSAYSASGSTRRLRVRPRWQSRSGMATTETSLWTAYLWDGKTFSAAPRPAPRPDLVDGLLNLGSGDFDLEELDVDGAILKQANAASNLLRGLVRRTPDAPKHEAPAALRSSGFALTRRERALRMHGSFGRAAERNTQLEGGAEPATFFAEDLTRGFVADTWDSLSGRWHSLFRRIGEYRFEDGARINIEDEGFSQAAITQKIPAAGAPPSNEIRLHEAMWSWDGWSLAAPRPGKSILSGSGSGMTPERIGNEAETSLRMSVTFQAAPRSLPRLRFGARYRMRARAVDLAGNSRSLAEAGEASVIPAQGSRPYLRFDPVHPPTVVLREEIDAGLRPGETVERLVIRSENSAPGADSTVTAQNAERHIVAPRTSLLACEWHGKLDGPDGRPLADPANYATLRARDAAELTYAADGSPVEPGATLTPPYLPEPMSRGAALRNLPGTVEGTISEIDAAESLVATKIPGAIVRPGTATLIPFEGWPDVPGFLIVLVEGDAAPSWDAASRRLTVSLPKAEVVDVPLSSYVHADDLHLFGVWEWLRAVIEGRAQLNARQPASMLDLGVQTTHVAQYALEGGLWAMTPARTLRLVHAVQQPLGPPRASFIAHRNPTDTFARLVGEIAVHGKSTGTLDISASWDDRIDDPAAGPPRSVSFNDYADTIAIRELVPASLRNGNRLVGRYEPDRDAVVCDGHGCPRHEFGDTKHHDVRYRISATSRFTDCFPPTQAGGFTRAGDEILLDVPASARPAAPDIEYIVPTFGWQRHTETNLTASVRLGQGLRVYMRRGWYSSGNGELLGVVLHPYTNANPDNERRERLKSTITQWGADPIWGSPSLAPLPFRRHFPRATEGAERLRLPESPEFPVSVAGHKPEFDAAQGRWYCDIEVDTGNAYFPFVRLALARFQPSAIDGCHLSPVVLAAFSQVAPNRTMIATHDPDDASRIHVVVSGFTYDSSNETVLGSAQPAVSGSQVRIEVQRRIAGLEDELGWEPAVDVVVMPLDTQRDSTVLWRGTVQLPSPRLPDQFRIVAREYETHLGDTSITWIPFNGLMMPLGPFPNPVERMVYADGIVV